MVSLILTSANTATCTADITTANRKDVVAVPIPAVAVRELVYDAKGGIVKQPRTDKPRPAQPAAPRLQELEPDRRARRPRVSSSSATDTRSSFRSR